MEWPVRSKSSTGTVISVGLLLLAMTGSAVWAAETAVSTAAGQAPFFGHIQARAEALASKPFTDETSPLPPPLADLDYDQYRDIRFRADQSLWRAGNLPFQLQFFSRGSIFDKQVKVHVLDQDTQALVEFIPEMFDFGRLPVPLNVPKDVGFAGFRLHYPINTHEYLDEVIAFLGASYFRAVGRNQVYGLSARGLALNTGGATGEEFPVFREFWLQKPALGAEEITLYALLDSASVTGAYRFDIRPGAATAITVKVQLYFRSNVERLGIAPLTSMFYHGKTTQHYVDDFRPEVHDSDGLLIETSTGEQIWRPLNNPQRLAFSNFEVTSPRGFGLLQRERNFDRYEDLEANYQDRPSAWITPVGDWGSGTIELVEIPSEGEIDDNVVAFWVPSEIATAGSSRAFEYTLSFENDPQLDWLGGRVTYMGIGPGPDADAGQRRFVIDFAGGELERLPKSTIVTADLSTSAGTLGSAVVERDLHSGGYRVSFSFSPGDEPLAELRCTLRAGANVISEAWTYQWRMEKY